MSLSDCSEGAERGAVGTGAADLEPWVPAVCAAGWVANRGARNAVPGCGGS